jgi:hypothetical protein
MKDLDDLIARYSTPPEEIPGEAGDHVRAAAAEMKRKHEAGEIAPPPPPWADNKPIGLREDYTPFPLDSKQVQQQSDTSGRSEPHSDDNQ